MALVALVFVLATAGAVSALTAKTINGTARNDTLRGTAAADAINGKAGNDRLIGLAGADRLTGGPGVDSFSCGPGADTVFGDSKDRRPGKDCEVVTGIPVPPPSPPPPPAPTAKPGRYCGFTNQGVSVCLDVTADGHGVTNLATEVVADCQPSERFKLRVTTSGTLPLSSDLRFANDFRSADLDQQVTGTLDTIGNVTGTLHVRANFDFEGTRYKCDSGAPTAYTARLGA